MWKVILFLIAAVMIPAAARAGTVEKIVLTLIVAPVFIIALLRSNKRVRVNQTSDPKGSTRSRTRQALRAVRKKQMTMAEASEHFDVSQHAISKMNSRYLVFVDFP